MRKTTIICISVLSLTACNNTGIEHKVKHFPKPGSVVAQAEMPITNDSLNHFVFSLKVIADSNVSNGVYDVDADYGPNYATGEFVLPKGAEGATPVIRKSTEPYTYIIGFKLANDTTFYDYFEVSSTRLSTKMRYVKAYTF